jgi:GNAT superfamily N-acetyltransferase
MTDRLTVRTATIDDLPDVHEILDEAGAWLRERGIHQWPTPYPRDPIEQACASRLLWVGSRAGRVVATMRTARRDPDIWGDDSLPALYVHALAVRREPLARGSGLELLRWAAQAAAHEGIIAVRLDCWAENRRLRRYYEQAGFRHVGDVHHSFGSRDWRSSLFEMTVSGLGPNTAFEIRGTRPGPSVPRSPAHGQRQRPPSRSGDTGQRP